MELLLELFEQAPESGQFVFDSLGTQGVPDRGCVDGDYRFAQFLLKFCGYFHGAQVGSCLHQGVHLRAVDGEERLPDLLAGDFGDVGGGSAGEAMHLLDFVAHIGEVGADLLIADGLVGRDEADPPGAELLQGRIAGSRAGGEFQAAGLLADAGFEGCCAFGTAPEGFRGHAHHDAVRLGGQDVPDGVPGLRAKVLEEFNEGRVVAQFRLADEDAARCEADSRRAHEVVFSFHDGVGGRHNHAQDGAFGEVGGHRIPLVV